MNAKEYANAIHDLERDLQAGRITIKEFDEAIVQLQDEFYYGDSAQKQQP